MKLNLSDYCESMKDEKDIDAQFEILDAVDEEIDRLLFRYKKPGDYISDRDYDFYYLDFVYFCRDCRRQHGWTECRAPITH